MNPIIMAKVMHYYREVRDELKSFPKISCVKGCSHCCYHPIWVSPLEGLFVETNLRINPSILAPIKKEWHDWYNRIQTEKLPLELEQKLCPSFNAKYFELKIKCPFLINNLCSIYHFRPLVCRTYFTKASPDTCKTGVTDNEYEAYIKVKFIEMQKLNLKLLGPKATEALPTLLFGNLAELMTTRL